MSLKTHIEGNTVKKIEVGGKIILARNNGVPMSELTEIIEAFNVLIKHFDFESIGEVEEEAKEWSREEIFEFLDERNERQIMFFSILDDESEIDRESLIEKMVKKLKKPDFDGRTLAGILGGIGIRTNSLEKEPLYEKDWREEDEEWVCYYRLFPKYVPVVREWFEEED